MKTCPFCAEEIQDAAVKCKHCGEMLGAPPAVAAPIPVGQHVAGAGRVEAQDVQKAVSKINGLLAAGEAEYALDAARELKKRIEAASNRFELAIDLAWVEQAIHKLESRGKEARRKSIGLLQSLGIGLLVFGIYMVISGLAMDTTVVVPGKDFGAGIRAEDQRVHNIGLISDRQITIVVGSFAVLGGLLLTLFGSRAEIPEWSAFNITMKPVSRADGIAAAGILAVTLLLIFGASILLNKEKEEPSVSMSPAPLQSALPEMVPTPTASTETIISGYYVVVPGYLRFSPPYGWEWETQASLPKSKGLEFWLFPRKDSGIYGKAAISLSCFPGERGVLPTKTNLLSSQWGKLGDRRQKWKVADSEDDPGVFYLKPAAAWKGNPNTSEVITFISNGRLFYLEMIGLDSETETRQHVLNTLSGLATKKPQPQPAVYIIDQRS